MANLIIVSTKTNNTLKVATAANEVLTDATLMRIEKISASDIENADFILSCFWLDSGHIDNPTLELLPKLKNKKVAFLGTLGGDPSGTEAIKLMDKTIATLDESNTFLGSLWVRGRISEAVLKMMYERFPKIKEDPKHQERIQAAATHPDEADFAEVKKQALCWYQKAIA